jgi:hypothetical protein
MKQISIGLRWANGCTHRFSVTKPLQTEWNIKMENLLEAQVTSVTRLWKDTFPLSCSVE